ncbi:MAG: hypothetical protein PHX87_04530 [Candidatus Peribacteraceae bacterium]|nr:hypothetical protein [Candidatus Peribacteraceae bacterium]MDD5742664.1 hypothetical protein [Candidatus Peribacteraceae bacterium]
MTDLHPNWQATDPSEEEQSLPVHVAKKQTDHREIPVQNAHPPRMRRLSRQPAAIAGMLLAITIGLSFFFGFGRGTETTVRITEQGFSPRAVTVTAGEDIRWINETDRPQMLQSDVLCTRNQECFSTRTIAPQKSATLTITSDFDAGTYAYYSISTRGMEASITVLAGTAETKTAAKTATQQNLAQTVPFGDAAQGSAAHAGASQSSSLYSRIGNMAFALPPADEDGFVDITSVLTGDAGTSFDGTDSGQSSLPFGAASSDSQSASQNRFTQLPVNPYTVNGTRTHPFDAQGKPIVPGSASSFAKSTLHGGAPRPLAQPSTGPALWITIAGSFALLFFATRNVLKKAHI